jgi:hypothetical protein
LENFWQLDAMVVMQTSRAWRAQMTIPAKNTRIVSTLFVTLALAVAVALMNSRPAIAQNPTDNGPAVHIVSPLPLPVTGSTTVSGTVGVSGTVQVSDVDRIAKTPFTIGLAPIGGGGFCQSSSALCQVSVSVPAGELFVIETLAASAQAPAGQKVTANLFAGADFSIPLQVIGTFSGLAIGTGDILETILPTRVYVQPGQVISVTGLRNGSGGSFVLDASISGFSVNCASAGCPVP